MATVILSFEHDPKRDSIEMDEMGVHIYLHGTAYFAGTGQSLKLFANRQYERGIVETSEALHIGYADIPDDVELLVRVARDATRASVASNHPPARCRLFTLSIGERRSLLEDFLGQRCPIADGIGMEKGA